MDPARLERACIQFIDQYYAVLQYLPEELYRFYEDESRQDSTASMAKRDMNCMYQKLVGLETNERSCNIKTYDVVESQYGGIHILVTGSVAGLDFIQTFFLEQQQKKEAQQKKDAYFVLTDIARFIDVQEASTKTVLHNNELNEDVFDKDLSVPASESQPSTGVESTLVTLKEESFEKNFPHEKLAAPILLEDNPKTFWADIVEKEVPETINAASSNQSAWKVFSTLAKKQTNSSSASSLKVTPTATTPASQKKDFNGKGVSTHSVYVCNLPQNITPIQLKDEFKKFGSIKPDGVQVRAHKDYGSCFGFVAFEEEISVQKALEAPPIIIKQKRAIVARHRENPHQGSVGAGNNVRGGDNYNALHRNYESRDGYRRNTNLNDEYGHTRLRDNRQNQPKSDQRCFHSWQCKTGEAMKKQFYE